MRNLKSIAGAIAFMVLWAGAALAMPTAFFAPDDEPTAVADLIGDVDLEGIQIEQAAEGETVDVTVPDEDSEGEDPEEEGEARPDNHGKAVSTAAHCPLKGRAKGALVSSVARDKTATAESAQAACDAAVAAAAAGTTATKPAKPEKAAKAPKPVKAAPPAKPAPKAPQPADGDQAEAPEVESPDEASTSDSGPPANAGPPADKGPKKP